MHLETRRSPHPPSQRRGASQLATQLIVILLMVGTFVGFFGFLYFSNRPPAAAKSRQVMVFLVTHDRTCKEMDPIVTKLVDAGLNIQRIDIEAEPTTKDRHNVVLVPCTIVLEEGKEISRQTGPLTEEALRAKLTGK